MLFQFTALHLGLLLGNGLALQPQRALAKSPHGSISTNAMKYKDNRINGRSVDCGQNTLNAFDQELDYIHEWLVNFRATDLTKDDPQAKAFVPEGMRTKEEDLADYLFHLKTKLRLLADDLNDPLKKWPRPDIPVICPVEDEDEIDYCGAEPTNVLAAWTKPNAIFPNGVLALCPRFLIAPSTRSMVNAADKCAPAKTLDLYDTKGITVLHELMHDQIYLDTIDEKNAYGPFCCQALANCDPQFRSNAERYGRNSDSIAWLIASLWWAKQCGGNPIPMPDGNFAEECPDIYFAVYREQRTTITTTKMKTAGANEATFSPEWETPPYCSSTPGVWSTITRGTTITVPALASVHEEMPQQTGAQGANVEL